MVPIEAHVCPWCDAGTLHWVLWQNSQGAWVYFCDNDCLVQWIEWQRDNACREVALECQQRGAGESAGIPLWSGVRL
jgi:hypothetical protein